MKYGFRRAWLWFLWWCAKARKRKGFSFQPLEEARRERQEMRTDTWVMLCIFLAMLRWREENLARYHKLGLISGWDKERRESNGTKERRPEKCRWERLKSRFNAEICSFFSNVHAMKSMLLDFCDTFLCFLPSVRYLEQFPLCLRFLALYCALRKIPPSPFSNAPVNNKVSKKFTEIPIFAVRHERKRGRSQHLSYDSRFPPL